MFYKFLNLFYNCLPSSASVKRYCYIFLFFSLLIINSPLSIAQSKPKIDSLELLLKTVKKDTKKVNILNKLSLEYLKEDPLKAFTCVNQGLALAVKTKYKEGISASYNNLGFIFQSLGDNITTLKYFNKSMEINAELLKQTKFSNNPDKRWRIKQKVVNSNDNIALLYETMGEYSDVFNYFFKNLSQKKELLELAEQSKDSDKIVRSKQGIVSCYNNIGLLYLKQGAMFSDKEDTAQASQDYSTGLRMFFESLKINEEIDDKHGIAHSFNYIGLVYYNKGNLFCEKGNTAQANQNYAVSLENYFISLKIGKEQGDSAKGGTAIGEKAVIGDTYMNIGLVYAKYEKYGDALEYFKKELAIAEKAGLKERMKIAYRELININDILGDYKKAYEYHKLYSAINDTLFNKEKSKELGNLEMLHKFMLEKMNKKAKAEDKAIVAEKREKRINLLQWTGLLICVMLSFSLVFIFFNLLIPVRLAKVIVFVIALLCFMFVLALTNPYVEALSGRYVFKLLIYAGLAVMIFPLYRFFEANIKSKGKIEDSYLISPSNDTI